MIRLDEKLSLNHIDYKRGALQRKPTMDSLLEAIADQPQTDKAQLLDIESWQRAHPVQTDLGAKFDVLHNPEMEFMHDDNYHLQKIQNMEQRPNFATRFRER